MNRFFRFVLNNRSTVILLALVLVVYGIVSAFSIKQEKYPDVEMPSFVMQVQYPNHSAEEAERDVTVPLENVVGGLRPYDSLTSQTSAGSAVIQASYEFGTNMDALEQEAETAAAKLNLPQDAKLTFKRISADSRPVYQVALASADAAKLQRQIENELLPELGGIEGVSSVDISGVHNKRLDIRVDEAKAAANGLTLSDIRGALSQANYLLPLGSIAENGSQTVVSLEGHAADLEAIRSLPIPSKTASALKLQDIAQLTEQEQAANIVRYNGQPAILLEVYKTQDSNTAEVVDQVKRKLDDFQREAAFDSNTIVDQGADVKASVESLLREGAFGALFTILVILLFLRNARATVIAVISLPLSILGTIAALNGLGYSLNIMTMGGMAVAVGRIVDDSIVVIENIFRWLRKEPDKSRTEILVFAAKEVAGAVSASTVATVVVFLPLAFVDGLVGAFFQPFSVAVVVSILLSLLIAFLLIPALAALFFTKLPKHRESGRLTQGYIKLLRGAIARKWIVLTLAVALLAGSAGFAGVIGKSFLPSEPSDELLVRLELPATAMLEQTDEMVRAAEAQLKSREEIRYVQVFAGQSNAVKAMQQSKSGNNTAELAVGLRDVDERSGVRGDLEQSLNKLVQDKYPSGKVTVKEQKKDGPPSGDNVEVTLYGDNMPDLLTASQQAFTLMAANTNLKNLSSTASQLQNEYTLTLSQEARQKGISPALVYQQAKDRLQPMSAGSLNIDGRVYEATIHYDRIISGKDDLLGMKLATPDGPMTLGDIADATAATVPASIQHQDGKTAVRLAATVDGEGVGQATAALKKDLAALSLPAGVSWEVGGGQKLMQDGFRDLGTAMALAVALVFVVLFLTFGGFLTPIVILSSLLFVPFGSLGALYLTGETLSMSGMIGMLMLIGIVVTNAVVLLERIEANRRSGIALGEAVMEACSVRLRPIVMTALATVCALIPLALSHSGSGLISKGLAISVIGGLTTTTLLTLVFIPVLYSMLGRWRRL